MCKAENYIMQDLGFSSIIDLNDAEKEKHAKSPRLAFRLEIGEGRTQLISNAFFL
jgi:hypothetical protein